MKNQFLIMEKLKDSLKGLDEATKNAEADRAALIMRIDELEKLVLSLQRRLSELEDDVNFYVDTKEYRHYNP